MSNKPCPKCKGKLTAMLNSKGLGLDMYWCPKCDIEWYCDRKRNLLVTKKQLYALRKGGY